MQHLHSYWRMKYIEAPKSLAEERKNPFIDLPKEENDKDAHIIYRAKHSFLVLNIFPYNAGHLLAVPYREVDELTKLTTEERADFMEVIIHGQSILQSALNPQGFNIGFNIGCAGGAGIPSHLHCHIVPRWQGDTNFMPVISDTRVLPESLDAMWERLKEFAGKSVQQ